jgi:hypothetical protein
VGIGLVALCALGVSAVSKVESRLSLEALPETISQNSKGYADVEAGSTETGVVTDASVGALVKAWPQTVLLTLYRPFLWEARSMLMLLAALENLVLLVFTVRALGQLLTTPQALARAFRSPMWLMCVLFVALFSLGVGASTPNLGSISRYRVPALPFLMAALIIVEHCCRVPRPGPRRPAAANGRHPVRPAARRVSPARGRRN